MKFKKNWLEYKWVSYTIATCGAVVLYVLLTNLPVVGGILQKIFSFIFPVFAGFVIAYLLDPLVSFFQKHVFHKIKSKPMGRRLSIFMTLAVVIAAVVLFFVALVPSLAKSIVNFALSMDQYVNQLQNLLTTLSNATDRINIDVTAINDVIDNVSGYFQSLVTDNMQTILNTTLSIGTKVFTFVISGIIAIYLLADKLRLQAGAKRFYRMFVNEKHYEATKAFVKRCNRIIYRYLGYDLLDALIVGIANAIFMNIAGMQYAILVSLVVGITNLAPTFGPIVGAAIGALILVFVNPLHALFFLIFTIFVQLIDGYILKPKLFGDSLGVPAVWVLISIIVGGRMFGVWGIMLAIPFAAISDFMYEEVFCVKMEERRKKLDEKQKKKTGDSQIESPVEEKDHSMD